MGREPVDGDAAGEVPEDAAGRGSHPDEGLELAGGGRGRRWLFLFSELCNNGVISNLNNGSTKIAEEEINGDAED